MQKICYMCGKMLSEHPTDGECKCHDEHIISNAIGGHLKCREILCESCGGKLSNGDAAFAEIMSPFIVLLDNAGMLRRLDRDNVGRKVLPGRIFENNSLSSEPIFDIKYQDGKAIPVRPSFEIDEDKKQVVIFAEKKTAKKYQMHVEKEMREKGLDTTKYEFVVCDDLLSKGFLGIYFSHGKPTFNKDFEEGLLKIVVEFALSKGLKREELSSVLSINEQTNTASYKNDSSVWPYIPMSLADIIYENERYKIDSNYPSHILNVFSERFIDGGKYLICYVELFSTFQYYIMLNDDYKGDDVNFVYAQKLNSNYVPSMQELMDMDYSDLDIIIKEAKLFYSDISHLDKDDLCNKIYNVFRKKDSTYDLYRDVDKSYEKISSQILLSQSCSKDIEHFVTLNDSSLEGLKDLQKAESMNWDEVMTVFRKQSNKENFRKFALKKQNGVIVAVSYPKLCMEYTKDHIDLVKEYTNIKFSHLCYFCMKNARIKTE